MANDPHRDILPVKDSPKNAPETLNASNISKLKRSELEDKYFRLIDEYNSLKQITNSQEIKIKKIGTKLLRVIKEKRNGEVAQNTWDLTGSAEELQAKILELQHENYVLKDKNTVLKQQLSSHSKQHMAAHPTIFRRAQPSPRLTQRHTSVSNVNDGSFSLTNLPITSDLQLRDAEEHIAALNEEIKRLHKKIESLQNEVEKSSLVQQKGEVSENIELIKIKRQYKQMDARLKAAEHKLKIVQKENLRLQRENEDALQIISEKQNEMIDVQSKANEAASIQMQFIELKENITDLTNERDLLKERCEVLLKTIKEKHSESQVNIEVAQLKRESMLLRQELDSMRMENLDASYKRCNSVTVVAKIDAAIQTETPATNVEQVNLLENEIIADVETYNIMRRLEQINKKHQDETTKADIPVVPKATSSPVNEDPNNANVSVPEGGSTSLINALSDKTNKRVVAENLNLQREAEYLRSMLRAQTQRCDVQEIQILKLKQELQLNEVRYKDIVQQRDLFFRLLDKSSRNLVIDNEDKQSVKSVREESECPSGGTYVKNAGTYTKTSPLQLQSELSSPIAADSQHSFLINRTNSPAESAMHSTKTSPLRSQMPVPKPRNALASVQEPKKEKMIGPVQVKISILWLQLDDKSKLLADVNVKALYVDFTILSQSSEEFETPQALPKPNSAQIKSHYNFHAGINWNEDMMKLIKGKSLEEDVVVFNVVSEPVDGGVSGELQCPVVGLASVNLHQFIFSDANEDILLPVFEMSAEKGRCGTLAVRFDVPSDVTLQFK